MVLPVPGSPLTSRGAAGDGGVDGQHQVLGGDVVLVPWNFMVKVAEGNARVADLVKKGACTSCHGENFSQPVSPGFPKIAGQHSDYLFVALKSYKTEGHTTWGRANGVMGGIAKQFTNAELKELAAYLSNLPSELKTVKQSIFR
jgi:cytochrome c553